MILEKKDYFKSPLVSIIINCYNGEKYLGEALDSILRQSYGNWEIIFWDNQSTDSSKKIFLKYNDKRFKYFYSSKHELLYKARAQAIKKISGDFVAFLDTDDIWHKDKIIKQLNYFKNNDITVVYSNYWILNQNKKKKLSVKYNKKLPTGYILENILTSYDVGMLSVMIRSKTLKNEKYIFDDRFEIIGDFDLMVRMAGKYKFECVQEPIAFYRRHESNISYTKKKKGLSELLLWAKEVMKNRPYYYNKKLKFVFDKIYYEEAKILIEQNNRLKSLKYIKKININIQFIKIIILFCIPNIIITKFKF